jgi:hypothetical protein
MMNDTYTNDGYENPYTVYRILQQAASNLKSTDSLVEAVEAAMTSIVPDVCDPGDHFATALDVLIRADVDVTERISDQPWSVRYQRETRALAEALVYAGQLYPAIFSFTPRIGENMSAT